MRFPVLTVILVPVSWFILWAYFRVSDGVYVSKRRGLLNLYRECVLMTDDWVSGAILALYMAMVSRRVVNGK